MWQQGENATFTYLPDGAADNFAMSTESLVSLRFLRWGMESVLELIETTPIGYAMAMYTPGVVRVRGVLHQIVESSLANGAPPYPPDGTEGTLTLTLGTGMNYTVRAMIFSLSVEADPNAPRMESTYGFVGTAAQKHDTLRRSGV